MMTTLALLLSGSVGRRGGALVWLGGAVKRSIEAENLFLRRQLALYVERGVEPRRMDSATRVALAFLSRFFTGGTLWWWCARKQ